MSAKSRHRQVLHACMSLLAGSGIACYGSAVYYRPLPSSGSSDSSNRCVAFLALTHTSYRHIEALLPPVAHSLANRKASFVSPKNLSDVSDMPEPLSLQIARRISICLTVCVGRAFLMGTGDFRILDDKNYENFVNKVKARSSGIPLITVSNHVSMFDDPVTQAWDNSPRMCHNLTRIFNPSRLCPVYSHSG